MSKEKILYIVLGLLFVVYVIVEFYAPKPINWTVTFAERDTNPYGAYLFYDRLEDIFPGKEISYQTLFEVKDATGPIIILADKFTPAKTDIQSLFDILGQGKSVFIGANYFSEELMDTLGLRLSIAHKNLLSSDTLSFSFQGRSFPIPAKMVGAHFAINSPQEWIVYGQVKSPVLVAKSFEHSQLILCTTPLILSNYSFIQVADPTVIASILSLLPYEKVTYNRFYQAGKMEAKTPLRYLLSQAPLQWAVYLTLLALGVLFVTGSQRKQRAIPLLDPQTNTTVHFIKTIGGLYHREGNHKNAAVKLINHFQNSLSSRYYISQVNEKAYHTIAAKTGHPVVDVIEIFGLIEEVKKARSISESQLKNLYTKINLLK